MEGIIERIEEKILEIRDGVRALGDDGFNEQTRLDVHALLCMMRIAVWEDRKQFEDWLATKTHEINGTILERIIILETEKDENEENLDGVELRFHVFRESEATFIHNHRQDFITVALSGSYRYTWYIPSDDNSSATHIHQWRRKKGGQLLEYKTSPGSVVKAKRTADYKMEKDDTDGHSGEFNPKSEPMFVHNSWFHSVQNQGIDSSHPMVTFVVRRGKKNNGTFVISNANDATEDTSRVRSSKHGTNPESKPDGGVTPQERMTTRSSVLDALAPFTEESARNGNLHYTDLESYITPVEQLLRIPKNRVRGVAETEVREAALNLMKSNGFSFLPLADNEEASTSFMLLGQLEHLDGHKIVENLELNSNTHILDAILWVIATRNFVIPVKKEGRFIGMFSLSNVNNAEFEHALMVALTELPESSDKEDERDRLIAYRITHARKLLEHINALHRCVYGRDGNKFCKPSIHEVDQHIHKVLVHLGPLITVAPHLNLGRFLINQTDRVSGLPLHYARYPMHKFRCALDDVEEREKATLALELIVEACDFSQLLLLNQQGQATHVLRKGEKAQRLALANQNMSIKEILSEFANSPEPLYTMNDKAEYGIFSIYELLHPTVLKQMDRFVAATLSSHPNAPSLAKEYFVCLNRMLEPDWGQKTHRLFSEFCKALLE
jgi:hypothetical protein